MTRMQAVRAEVAVGLLLATLWVSAHAAGTDAPADKAVPLCATAAEAALVEKSYAAPVMAPPFLAAPRLGVSEAVVLSALAAGPHAIGTTGAGFAAIWTSLQSWSQATIVIMKGGQVFEVHGQIPAGTPSTKSQYFNLDPRSSGLSGHLRPDLLGAIYAVDLVGAQGPVRGVTFVDQAGNSLFGAYLPEGVAPTPELNAQFEKTRAVIASLPRSCSG